MSLYLVDVVAVQQTVHVRVQVVEHLHHLEGRAWVADLREADDVAEEYRAVVVVFGVDFLRGFKV